MDLRSFVSQMSYSAVSLRHMKTSENICRTIGKH